MTVRTTGVAVVEALLANGVELVFGIPGTHSLELYRGMAERGLRHVVTRHEQGAAYAADGYTRATGRPGVVVTTSGPGLTNALTGIANAHADGVPMLVISPGIPTGRERQDTGWMHETKDQRSATDNLAARSIRVGTPAQAVDIVHETFARWAVEHPRPVHIEIPLDVLEAAAPEGGVAWARPYRPGADPAGVSAAADLIAAAEAITMVVGPGGLDAAAPVRALAAHLDVPVVTTTLAKGVVDEHHPCSVGEFFGERALAPLLEETDLLIVLGAGVPEMAERYPGFTGRIVRVDLDPGRLHRNAPADVALLGDVGLVATQLLSSVAPQRHRGGERAARARAGALAAMEAYTGRWRAIQDALQAALPPEVIVTGDSSQVSYRGTGPYWAFSEPRHYLVTTGYSTLGYALPAAIGAKLARPDTPVVALTGDGALMFCVQELMTVTDLGLALPVLVVDNHGFGEIRENMQDRSIPPFAVSLDTPDFLALARSMGWRAHAASDPEHAAGLMALGLAADGPTLVHLGVPA